MAHVRGLTLPSSSTRPETATLNPIDTKLRWTLFAAVALLAGGGIAHAQVIEIGADGAATLHDRPEVILNGSRTPIQIGQERVARHRAASNSPTGLVHVDTAAGAAELSPELVEAVAWRESRLRSGVVSAKGAIGEMQLMPRTAQALGVDPFDSAQNLRGGASYLKGLLHRYDGDVVRALAAYNAGPGAVDRFGGVPPFKETRDYVAAVLDRMSTRAVGDVAPAKR